MEESVEKMPASRPDGVVLTAVWFALGAVFWLLGVAAMLIFALPPVLSETSGSDQYYAVAGVSFGALVVAIMGVVSAITAVGLFRMRPWSRYLAIVLAALGLLAIPIGTVVGGLIIWYMLQDEAKIAFGVISPPPPASPVYDDRQEVGAGRTS